MSIGSHLVYYYVCERVGGTCSSPSSLFVLPEFLFGDLNDNVTVGYLQGVRPFRMSEKKRFSRESRDSTGVLRVVGRTTTTVNGQTEGVSG